MGPFHEEKGIVLYSSENLAFSLEYLFLKVTFRKNKSRARKPLKLKRPPPPPPPPAKRETKRHSLSLTHTTICR